MEMMSALRKIYGKTACRERQMSQGREEGKQKGLMSNCTKHTLFSGENVCLLTKHFHFGLLSILIYDNQHESIGTDQILLMLHLGRNKGKWTKRVHYNFSFVSFLASFTQKHHYQ